MKKIFYIFLLFSSILQAKVIEVGANKSIKSIKKAIALARVGDTVLVYNGVYKEGNISIDKKIVFIGKKYPILDGQKNMKSCLLKRMVLLLRVLK